MGLRANVLVSTVAVVFAASAADGGRLTGGYGSGRPPRRSGPLTPGGYGSQGWDLLKIRDRNAADTRRAGGFVAHKREDRRDEIAVRVFVAVAGFAALITSIVVFNDLRRTSDPRPPIAFFNTAPTIPASSAGPPPITFFNTAPTSPPPPVTASPTSPTTP